MNSRQNPIMKPPMKSNYEPRWADFRFFYSWAQHSIHDKVFPSKGRNVIDTMAFFVHLAAIWAIQQSPEGKPIPEIYICGVLLTLIFLGFLGEVFGLNALVVSFFVGLAIPNGPPLGATLVMNDECFAIMIVTLVFVTKIVSPIVKTLYDPSKRFLAYKRWTIMHHQNNEELHILA
ncbi:hypothetical protein JHK84_031784 [Glycine max]|nr:hypothetical protein JHK85_032211 [Glycine max]KAG4994819.1 hypothetical protein JHK86_031646 [Glycine max]KAG5146241.1 hypothetical protein JHK84_031784 [Glycine max]